MNLRKIGQFIADRRKSVGLTQAQLADQLNITDRAVSKWECGKSVPDSLIMIKLCNILQINVNELLSGEKIDMKDYNKKAEQNLIEMTKREEELNKKLLRSETAIGYMCTAIFLASMLAISIFEFDWYYKLPIAIVGVIFFIIGIVFCLDIETNAGYYECKECGTKRIPTKKETYWAKHMGRTRKMRCEHCGKKTWQKKVLTK